MQLVMTRRDQCHEFCVLSCVQGDIIALVRKVDANWYEGRVGDRKGIVPSSYLEVRTRC